MYAVSDIVDAVDPFFFWQSLGECRPSVASSDPTSLFVELSDLRNRPCDTDGKHGGLQFSHFNTTRVGGSNEYSAVRNTRYWPQYKQRSLNLLPINVVADISQIVHGLGLLQSAHLGQLSMAFLSNVVKKGIRRPPEPQDLSNYLCGSMEGAFANESPDISNIWTRFRSATRRLRSKINVSWVNEDGQKNLWLNGFLLQRGVAEYALHNSIREYHRQNLIAKSDQSKIYEITSATNPPKHFLRNGDFTRFADWRFIRRARLDCVPLNGSQRFGNKNRKCRWCGCANETLPHVLCHCKPNFVAIKKRHNAIQARLVRVFNASASTTVRINQSVPGLDRSLRPDFVAVNDTCKTVAIIDVTMPFENRYAAFQAARQEKQKKYALLAQHYNRLG